MVWIRLKKRQTPVWLAHLSSKSFNGFASGALALAKAGQHGHRTFGPPVQDVQWGIFTGGMRVPENQTDGA